MRAFSVQLRALAAAQAAREGVGVWYCLDEGDRLDPRDRRGCLADGPYRWWREWNRCGCNLWHQGGIRRRGRRKSAERRRAQGLPGRR